MDDLRKKVIRGLECCLHGPMQCEKFPYMSEVGKTVPNCVKTMRTDAVSLLKAQEPRVMTLEEIKDYDKPVWIDEKGWGGWKLPFYKFDLGIYAIFGHECYLVENYGKEWLPWTSRPTEEQRKKVKWK